MGIQEIYAEFDKETTWVTTGWKAELNGRMAL
jgi:hypothetical protein